MNKEAQRIAIAEACGHVEPACWGNLGWLSKAGGWKVEFVPDYLTDLNAMHEAEKVLTYKQQIKFCDWFKALFNPCPFSLMHATAAQRAEAFLRTLNLWTPSP